MKHEDVIAEQAALFIQLFSEIVVNSHEELSTLPSYVALPPADKNRVLASSLYLAMESLIGSCRQACKKSGLTDEELFSLSIEAADDNMDGVDPRYIRGEDNV